MTSWRGFWEGQSPFPLSTWDWQAELFLRQSREVFPIGENDTVLDVGCGPGALAFALAGRGAEASGARPALYHGLDVSQSALTQARERLASHPNGQRFHFAALGEDYLDLASVLVQAGTAPPPPSSPPPPFSAQPASPPRFTRLLALSVVQYYQSSAELLRLIEVMRTLAAPGAILLIADLPLRQSASALAETWRSLSSAAASGGLIRQVTFLARCALSPYRHARQKAGLLSFEREELVALAHDCDQGYGTHTDVLDLPLTVSTGRAHLRMVFP